MYSIFQPHVQWIDNNHAIVIDQESGNQFDVTVRQKANPFIAGNPVNTRLYIGGDIVWSKEKELTHRQTIKWAKEHFGPVLNTMLNRELNLKFSSTAGCSCGCSPGFIISYPYPFDIWMTAK